MSRRMRWSWCVSALVVALPAWADWSARVQAGAAVPVSNSLFGSGGAGSVALAWELFAPLDVVGHVDYGLLPQTAAGGLTQPGSFLTLGAGLRLRRPRAEVSLVPFFELVGQYARSGPLDRAGLLANAGVLWRLGDESPWCLGPAVGVQSVFKLMETDLFPTENAFLLTAGVTLEYAEVTKVVHDADADGLPDEKDACPSEAGPEATGGCPDQDGDGVPDAEDKCPSVKGSSKAQGCAEDADGDGLVGAADHCPTEPEDKDGFQDEDGCPDPDNDQDGVLDASDECPNDKGPAATKGCPDADGDGVPDKDDACPDVPGTVEDKGCRRFAQITVTESKIELKQKIFFAFGLPTILPKSYPLLDEVADALKDRPRLCVRIEGHTDNVGSVDRNMKLSQTRADAVRDYLRAKGLDAARLEAKGYGPSLPLDNNATAEGRENNRRVEFVIMPCSGPAAAP